MRANISSSIEELLYNEAQLIIGYFHWGREKWYHLHPSQQPLGRFAIDRGAHLVLGAHPHVVQGIEIYNGRNIVYSLGNFSFGGNRHPFDMDSFIFRQTFTFIDGVLQDTNDREIIPVRTTSTPAYNNLQPTLAEGADYDRIRDLIRRLSNDLNPPEYYDDGYVPFVDVGCECDENLPYPHILCR
jgi:poly-gamma-glutamate synthesis protein (capsule biosynthesis protein)